MTARWILLRGLTREAGHWGPFARMLERRSGAPVEAIDLPGNGRHCRAHSPWQVPAMAESVRRQATRGAPPIVIAMSLGAMVAIEWGRQAPHELAGCVLVNASAGGLNPFWQRLQPRNYPALARMFLPGLSPLAREKRVLRMTSARPWQHEGVPQTWAQLAELRPVSPANAWRQLWAAARYRAAAAGPPVPLLLLASRGDRLVSAECSRRLAECWAAPLQVHDWAGHDLPMDHPEWVAEQVLSWSRRLPRPDAGVTEVPRERHEPVILAPHTAGHR